MSFQVTLKVVTRVYDFPKFLLVEKFHFLKNSGIAKCTTRCKSHTISFENLQKTE